MLSNNSPYLLLIGKEVLHHLYHYHNIIIIRQRNSAMLSLLHQPPHTSNPHCIPPTSHSVVVVHNAITTTFLTNLNLTDADIFAPLNLMHISLTYECKFSLYTRLC